MGTIIQKRGARLTGGSTPSVSIIIPCYNAESSVAETIQNALAQTWPHKEIIVVDDGSTDRSREIVESFGDQVKLLTGPNRGGCVARNRGLAAARGDYIQFLDADDLMDAGKLAGQLALLEGSDWRTVAVCSVKRFDASSRTLAPTAVPGTDRMVGVDFLVDMWLRGGGYNAHGWLCHRRLLQEVGGWNERLRADQDGEYFARVLCAAAEVRFLENVFVYYRRGNPLSVASQRNYAVAVSRIRALRTGLDDVSRRRQDAQALQAMRNRCFEVGLYHVWYSPRMSVYALARGRALRAPRGAMRMGNWQFRLIYALFGIGVVARLRRWARQPRQN